MSDQKPTVIVVEYRYGRRKNIPIEYRQGETGLIYATSPCLCGLLVGRPSIEELNQALPQAVTDMYAANGEDVAVSIEPGA